MKLLTIVVPCYNSADYMCSTLDSLLCDDEDIEVLIVDDGSTDDTARIADEYALQHPSIVRVIHKENGGHGSAINAGLAEASGLYFKVVDSDDHLKRDAYRKVLAKLRELSGGSPQLDMMICNYVYDHHDVTQTPDGNTRDIVKQKVVQYRRSLPQHTLFSWNEVGHFRKGHYILMHAVIFRTKMLRECNLVLPEHCFYVDNLYVFHPLPYVNTMYYMDIDLYYYYIGRSDQSVQQETMIRRLDQQMRVNKLMFDVFSDKETISRIGNRRALRRYMYSYLEIITIISSVLPAVSNKPEDLRKRKALWQYFKETNRPLYRRLRYGMFGLSTNLHGKGGRAITRNGYRLVNHFYHFN